VRNVNRNAALGLGALVGAAAALVWDRRARLRAATATRPDERAAELRRKLSEPKAAEPDLASPPSTLPPAAPAPAQPPPQARPAPPAPPPGPPPADEFEAMRRRIHEEGKAAAEEMRRPDEAS
jgi:hypothetical protein